MASVISISFPLPRLVFRHDFPDPVCVSSYASVHAVLSRFSTVDAPANDPRCVKRAVLLHDEPGATVSLARVLPSFRNSSAEHVLRQSRHLAVGRSHALDGRVTHVLIHDGETDVPQIISSVERLSQPESRNPPEAETFYRTLYYRSFLSSRESRVGSEPFLPIIPQLRVLCRKTHGHYTRTEGDGWLQLN